MPNSPLVYYHKKNLWAPFLQMLLNEAGTRSGVSLFCSVAVLPQQTVDVK